jgi:hypothetical protein
MSATAASSSTAKSASNGVTIAVRIEPRPGIHAIIASAGDTKTPGGPVDWPAAVSMLPARTRIVLGQMAALAAFAHG